MKKIVKLSTYYAVVMFFVLSVSFLSSVQADIWYVDSAVTNGNGTSWEDAFNSIQDAVNAANEGDEIWVKMGTYFILTSINVSKAIFMYGGFTGIETQRDQRDWVNNKTSLDGQNSGVRRLSVHSSPTIDGFVITGRDGGGMYIGQGTPSIKNCIFERNWSYQGGGIFNEGSPTITNCVFFGNTATWDDVWSEGGGIYLDESATITNCIFIGNKALGGRRVRGGGLYISLWSDTIITNCIFSENQTTGGTWSNEGGAVYIEGSATLTNCSFVKNSVGS